MSAVRSNGGVLMNYLRRRQRQSQYVIKLAPTNAILRAPPTLFGLSKPPKRGSKVNQNSTLLLIVHTTGSRSNIRQRAPSDLSIPISISSAGGVARDRVDAALPQLPQRLSSGWSFSPHFLQNIVTLPPPVYANYADAEWNLMPNSYLDLVFNSIIQVHFTNKKDGPCQCANIDTTLTQTLIGQRRAETDSIRPTAISVGLFCWFFEIGDLQKPIDYLLTLYNLRSTPLNRV
jgi:hypothetical protein